MIVSYIHLYRQTVQEVQLQDKMELKHHGFYLQHSTTQRDCLSTSINRWKLGLFFAIELLMCLFTIFYKAF